MNVDKVGSMGSITVTCFNSFSSLAGVLLLSLLTTSFLWVSNSIINRIPVPFARGGNRRGGAPPVLCGLHTLDGENIKQTVLFQEIGLPVRLNQVPCLVRV